MVPGGPIQRQHGLDPVSPSKLLAERLVRVHDARADGAVTGEKRETLERAVERLDKLR